MRIGEALTPWRPNKVSRRQKRQGVKGVTGRAARLLPLSAVRAASLHPLQVGLESASAVLFPRPPSFSGMRFKLPDARPEQLHRAIPSTDSAPSIRHLAEGVP